MTREIYFYSKDYIDANLLTLIPINLTVVSGRTDKVTATGLEPASTKIYNVIIGNITINNTSYPVSGAWDYGTLTTNPIAIGDGITLEFDGTNYVISVLNTTDVIDITKTRLITMAQ